MMYLTWAAQGLWQKLSLVVSKSTKIMPEYCVIFLVQTTTIWQAAVDVKTGLSATAITRVFLRQEKAVSTINDEGDCPLARETHGYNWETFFGGTKIFFLGYHHSLYNMDFMSHWILKTLPVGDTWGLRLRITDLYYPFHSQASGLFFYEKNK